jgi:hypothetical protein
MVLPNGDIWGPFTYTPETGAGIFCPHCFARTGKTVADLVELRQRTGEA